MAWPQDGEPWFQFCNRLRVVSLEMLSCPMETVGPPLHHPVPYAAALLSRSLQHLQGLELVARAGLLVEAASLARACVENALWMRKLHREPEFAHAVLSDARHHSANFAKRIRKSPLDVGFDDEAEKLLYEMAQGEGSPVSISKTDAEDRDAERDYLAYRLLSSSYAHPSFTSLSRHLTEDQINLKIVLDPLVSADEFEGVFLYAALPMIDMVDYFSQIVLQISDHPQVAALELALSQVKVEIDARRSR